MLEEKKRFNQSQRQNKISSRNNPPARVNGGSVNGGSVNGGGSVDAVIVNETTRRGIINRNVSKILRWQSGSPTATNGTYLLISNSSHPDFNNKNLARYLLREVPGSKHVSDQGGIRNSIPKLSENNARRYVTKWHTTDKEIYKKEENRRKQQMIQLNKKTHYAKVATRLARLGFQNYVSIYQGYKPHYGLKLNNSRGAGYGFSPRVYIKEGNSANSDNVELFVVINNSLVRLENREVASPIVKYMSIEHTNSETPRYGKPLSSTNVVKLEMARKKDRNASTRQNKKEKFWNSTIIGYWGKRSYNRTMDKHLRTVSEFLGIRKD